nr:hypothetical protein [Tanacetum cinerariifolium]
MHDEDVVQIGTEEEVIAAEIEEEVIAKQKTLNKGKGVMSLDKGEGVMISDKREGVRKRRVSRPRDNVFLLKKIRIHHVVIELRKRMTQFKSSGAEGEEEIKGADNDQNNSFDDE